MGDPLQWGIPRIPYSGGSLGPLTAHLGPSILAPSHPPNMLGSWASATWPPHVLGRTWSSLVLLVLEGEDDRTVWCSTLFVLVLLVTGVPCARTMDCPCSPGMSSNGMVQNCTESTLVLSERAAGAVPVNQGSRCTRGRPSCTGAETLWTTTSWTTSTGTTLALRTRSAGTRTSSDGVILICTRHTSPGCKSCSFRSRMHGGGRLLPLEMGVVA